jgi:hypothetical protein
VDGFRRVPDEGKEDEMEARDLESKLGRLQADYTTGKGKIVINVILALIWLFLGFILFSLFWDYNSRVVAVVVGLVFLVSAAAYVYIPYRRRTGRQARLYEEGVWIGVRGKEQSWRFDEIDSVRVISGRDSQVAEGLADGIASAVPGGGVVGALAGGLAGGAVKAAVPTDELVGTDINSYQFFAGGERAFEIGPVYKEWKELGAAVFTGVMERLVPRLVHRLEQGEQVVFDKLTGAGFGKVRLTLTREGIQEKEKPPVAWADVVSVSEREGFATVEASDGKRNITFGVDSAQDSLVALAVVKAMAKDARASHG